MKFFAGIVPPEVLFKAILDLQQQFGDNKIEPHITLRAPVIPIDSSGWIEGIRHVCGITPRFNIHLSGTGYFGNRVLFINVQSKELSTLYREIKKVIKPLEPAAQQDNRPYHP